jgi:hypothetical protein
MLTACGAIKVHRVGDGPTPGSSLPGSCARRRCHPRCQVQPAGDGGGDELEQAQELPVAVPLVVPGDD